MKKHRTIALFSSLLIILFLLPGVSFAKRGSFGMRLGYVEPVEDTDYGATIGIDYLVNPGFSGVNNRLFLGGGLGFSYITGEEDESFNDYIYGDVGVEQNIDITIVELGFNCRYYFFDYDMHRRSANFFLDAGLNAYFWNMEADFKAFQRSGYGYHETINKGDFDDDGTDFGFSASAGVEVIGIEIMATIENLVQISGDMDDDYYKITIGYRF